MNEVRDATRQLFEALKTERDDLKVQMRLASMELKQELEEDWRTIEHRWAALKSGAKQVEHDAAAVKEALEADFEDIADDFSDMGESLMKDIRDGYSRIRAKLGKNEQ